MAVVAAMSKAATSLVFMMQSPAGFEERRESNRTHAADKTQFRRGLSFFYIDSAKTQFQKATQ
jgi:hypothetical protein